MAFYTMLETFKIMSIRVDELRNKAQIRLYKEEIEMYSKELNGIPWYTFDKEKRKYRAYLKTGIKGVQKLLSR
jgi:hypothetical protein